MSVMFDAVNAWNMLTFLIGGCVLLLIGGVLLAWFVYVPMTFRRVSAKIVGVRATGVNEAQGRPMKIPVSSPPVEKRTWAQFWREFPEAPGSSIAGLLLAGMIVLIPLVFIGVGIWKGHDYLDLRAQGIVTEGRIVDTESQTDSDGTFYYSIVSFSDDAGREWRVKERMGKGGSPFFSEGDIVTVHYDFTNPERMVIGGFWHNMFLPLIFGGLGTLVFMGFFVFPHFKRDSSAQKTGYAGEMYSTIYEYIPPGGGTPVKGEENGSSNMIGGRIPGMVVTGFIHPDRPDTLERLSLWLAALSILFIIPGVLMIGAGVRAGDFNPVTLLFLLGFSGWIGFKIKKMIKPREQWDTKQSFQARKREERLKKRQEGRLLTEGEIRDRLRVHDRNMKATVPVLFFVAAGLMAGGVWLGQDMKDFLARAERTAGEVVRVETVRSDSSDGVSYTHYPVVAFETPGGGRREFRDSVGSNPPLYETGDRVTVMYDSQAPQRAKIDRGLMNWAAAGGCLAGGLLLMILALRTAAGIRKRARM